MPNRTFALAASAALLALLSACKTAGDPSLASDTSPTRGNSSWCQGDAPIHAQADRAAQDNPGNQLDSDETVTAVQEYNARYRRRVQKVSANSAVGAGS